jgi:AraC-like DNA-binding protein
VARRAASELRIPDSVAPFAVEGLVLELLALAARLRITDAISAERRPPRWLGQARALLHDRYRDNLRLAEVADAVGVHPVHLARVFRLTYGTPVGTYVRGLRLSWATARLADSEDTIAQIASEAGFFDQSHFTRTFRQHFGLTPRPTGRPSGSNTPKAPCQRPDHKSPALGRHAEQPDGTSKTRYQSTMFITRTEPRSGLAVSLRRPLGRAYLEPSVCLAAGRRQHVSREWSRDRAAAEGAEMMADALPPLAHAVP